MQKKKKVLKTKTKAVKATASKSTPAKATAKKAAPKAAAKTEKPVKAEPIMAVATKTTAATKPTKPPVVKAPKKAKAAKVKVEAKPAHTVDNPATNAPITKEDFKNMSSDAQEHYKKWLKLNKQLAVEKPFDYKMTEDFELKAPISHKVHGWGVVMQKRDNYIDVLFEAGVKTLIVNYKP